MRLFNTKIREIDFKDLDKEDRLKYLNLLKKSEIQMTYDIENEEYLALVNLQKQKNPIKKIKKTVSQIHIPKHKNKQAHNHKDCYDDSIVNRKKIKDVQNFKKLNRRKSYAQKPENQASLNPQKKQRIQQYQDYFPEVNFYEMTSIPTIIPQITIYRKIEIFWNLLFDELQRKKCYTAISLSKVMYQYFEQLYKNNNDFKRLQIAKWVYSVDKQKKVREIDFFRQVMINRVDDDIILFYLYLRENYKFQTYHYFLNLDTLEIDPSQIKQKYKQLKEILKQALYFNDEFQKKMLDLFAKKFQNKKFIKYYEFLFFWIQDIDPKELQDQDILSYMIALYDQRVKPEIYQQKFQKNPHATTAAIKKLERLNSDHEVDIYNYKQVPKRKLSNIPKDVQKKKQQKAKSQKIQQQNLNLEKTVPKSILKNKDEKETKNINYMQSFGNVNPFIAENIQSKQKLKKSFQITGNFQKTFQFDKDGYELQQFEPISQHISEITNFKPSLIEGVQPELDKSIATRSSQQQKYQQLKRRSGLSNYLLLRIENEIDLYLQELVKQIQPEFDWLENRRQVQSILVQIKEKFMTALLAIQNNQKEKFFLIMRSEKVMQIYWERIISQYTFTFNRPDVNEMHVGVFVRSVLELPSFNQSIIFSIRNEIDFKQIKKLLNLQDSIFFQQDLDPLEKKYHSFISQQQDVKLLEEQLINEIQLHNGITLSSQ